MESHDTLAQGNVFLKKEAVERARLGKFERQGSRRPVIGQRPVAVVIARKDVRRSETPTTGRAGDDGAVSLVDSEDRIQRGTEFHQPERIDRIDAATRVGRHIEQQQRIAADTLIIDLQQLLHTFYLRRLGRTPEPARPDRYIGLGGGPVRSTRRTAVQHLLRRTPRSRLKTIQLERRPVRAAGLSPLVAHPAAAGAYIAEDHGLRLQALDRRIEQRPVIDLPAPRGPLSTGTVEPLLEHRTVTAVQHALQRPDKRLIVGRRAIARIVAVPGRDIHAEPEILRRTGIRKRTQHISLSVAPGTLRHGVRALGRRPETEAVVVLGREDHTPEPGGTGRLRPLAAVERRGLEDVFRLRPVTPFRPGERVGAEVAEKIHLHLLPGHLLRRRARTERHRRTHRAGGGRQQDHQHGKEDMGVFHDTWV